jgi:hypothetical protein
MGNGGAAATVDFIRMVGARVGCTTPMDGGDP